MNYLNIARTLITPAVVSLGTFAIILLQLPRLNAQEKTPDKREYIRQEKAEKLRLNVAKKQLYFGFENLIADWNYLRFIQYFGDGEARKYTGYSLIPDYFETIVERDPRFVKAYLSLSTANSIYAGRPDKTVTFMNEVLDSISPYTSPLGYYLWIYKGVDEILFLGDMKAAQHSYEMASKWASLQGADVVAARNRETAQFLANNPDSKQAQIGAWATILTNARDEKTQQRAISEIKALGGEINITQQGELKIKLPEAI